MASSFGADFNRYVPYLGVINELCANALQRHEEFKGRVKAELDYEEAVLSLSPQDSNPAHFASCAEYHKGLIQSRISVAKRTTEEYQRAQGVAHDLRQLNQKINLAYRKASQQSPHSQEVKELESLLRNVNDAISQVDETMHKIEKSFHEVYKQVEVLQANHPNAINVFGKIV